MTKYMKPLQALGTLLIAVAVTTACSSGDTIIDEPIVNHEAPKTYTMTVQATLGSDAATTRALGFDTDGKLNATWITGDVVKVLKYDSSSYPSTWYELGTLSVAGISNDGKTATLSGSFERRQIGVCLSKQSCW